MSKRIATYQISDRNPVDLSDEEEVNYSNSSGSERDERASEQELRQRKISKPRSLSQRNVMNKKAAPAFGNLFAGLPTNPFGQAPPTKDEDYDLKIRGLNKSFVESAQKLLERSPAADFTKLFQQYSKHLASFSVNLDKPSETLNKFEMSKLPETIVKPLESITKPFESVSKPFEFTKPVESISKPLETVKPVETSKPFELPKPVENAPPKPFEFPNPTETLKACEPIKPIESAQPAPMPFLFNPVTKPVEVPEVIEVSEESSSESEAESKPTFTFGATEKTTSAPLTFSFGSTASEPANKPFSFGTTPATTSTIGTSTTATASEPAAPAFKPFSFGAPATETTSAFKPFSFGSTTTETSTTSAFKPFSFGASNTESLNKPFSFGSTVEAPKAPNTTTANPFSFGSSSIGGLAPLPTFSFGATPSNSAGTGFTFSVPAVVASKGDQSDDGGDEIPPEEAESFTLTRTNSEQLKTGAGEENETCQHEQRCKVFMMDPTGAWIDLGVGVFKINRYNNETGKSRVLCRSEGNGKVILNALVSVPGMNVTNTEGKREVALLAVGPEGKLVKYLIRVKTLELAGELKTAIMSEIDYVKSGKN